MSSIRQIDSDVVQDWSLLIVAIVLWITVIHYAITQSYPRSKFGIVFLGVALIAYLIDDVENLLDEFDYKSVITLVLYAVTFVAVVVTTVYFFHNFSDLQSVRIGWATDRDYQMAAVIFLSVLYLTYRAFGVPFVSVVLVSLIYARFGPYFPGIFGHSGFTYRRMLQIIATDISGVYGSLNELMAAWIALFLLYAGLMQAYGAFDLILRISHTVSKYIKSGVAQSAVVASMIIGSINGSGTANAGITGSVTIPMMKEGGLSGETAAGIESVASTGGQILPPIMGAGAFLMAAIIGVPYSDIVLAALIPAVIFYTSVVVAVHYATINSLDEGDLANIDLVENLEVKSRRRLAVDGIRFGIPFLVLIYVLVVIQYTITTAALYTTTSMFLFGIGIPLLQTPTKETGRKMFFQTLDGLKTGASVAAPIAVIVAAINAIVDVLLATGIPSTLAVTLAQISGGVLLVALVVSMIICIILGLGMPTSAAYLVVALLVAPALVEEFGVTEIAAHFFVFYAAILATITPPIATGVAVASGIAQAGFWRSSKEALKIGAPLFLLPFLFIYHPEVITPDVTLEALISAGFGLCGAIAVVYGFNNPKTDMAIGYLNSLIYIGSGLVVMLYPSNFWRLGALLFAIVYLIVVDEFVLSLQENETKNLLKRFG